MSSYKISLSGCPARGECNRQSVSQTYTTTGKETWNDRQLDISNSFPFCWCLPLSNNNFIPTLCGCVYLAMMSEVSENFPKKYHRLSPSQRAMERFYLLPSNTPVDNVPHHKDLQIYYYYYLVRDNLSTSETCPAQRKRITPSWSTVTVFLPYVFMSSSP